MEGKTRVAILFGGKSAEHEVSLQSARNVIEALDKGKYEPVLIGIGKNGEWHLCDQARFLLRADDPKSIALEEGQRLVALPPGDGPRGLAALARKEEAARLGPEQGRSRLGDSTGLGSEQGQSRLGDSPGLSPKQGQSRLEDSTGTVPVLDSAPIDVVFPVLHGPFGEDGTVQGLLKLADVPFVGAGVLGSAVGMDKDVMKRLLRDADIPIARFLVLRGSRHDPDAAHVERELGYPCFVKPANMGSSVGIGKVHDEAEFAGAVAEAFQYDSKVLVEECIEGREIECSVLGNDDPVASVPGEIRPRHEFYSYEAKYLDENGAVLEIPAKLSDEAAARIQQLAIQTFRTLCCEGMARVDFFLRGDGEIIVNEINTIPGFTRISMYPKLWEATGISYSDLIDRLIQLAIERYKRERTLRTRYL